MPKWSPQINYLAYDDDIILFGSGDKYFIIQMIKIISKYEEVSSQMVNKGKTLFYVHDKSLLVLFIRLRKITRLRIGNFPFNYLRCPVSLKKEGELF